MQRKVQCAQYIPICVFEDAMNDAAVILHTFDKALHFRVNHFIF